MDLVQQFLEQYRKEYDFYDHAARLAAQLVEQKLQSAGIRAIVTARAKSPGRLGDKIRKRMPRKHYSSIKEIADDIVDLAGIRIALYFPAERDQVNKIIPQVFASEGMIIKNFPASTDEVTTSQNSAGKRFSGYAATHYRARLRESLLNDAQKDYSLAPIETQVASVLMHAWAEVEHDLVYKPAQGALSAAEYALLDQINGLVLAGEIALEQLQMAGKQRLSITGQVFESHYDLASYLLGATGDLLSAKNPDALLGRINVLFRLLRQLDLATPDRLAPYLKAINADFERRPLADQVIDQLLAEDSARYDIYAAISNDDINPADRVAISPYPKETSSEVEAAVGQFLLRWIELEKLVRDLSPRSDDFRRGVVPTTTLVRKITSLSDGEAAEFDVVRRFRNHLVHGVEIPSVGYIRDITGILERLLDKLRPLTGPTSDNNQ